MEKIVGKGEIPPALISSQSSGLSMVAESDPRPAVTSLTAGAEFPLLVSPE
jgi:hypothetical protein